jgi:CHAT domain-containing protein
VLSRSGEPILSETVAALSGSDRTVAALCIEYRAAMKAYREQAIGQAHALWPGVAKGLNERRIPLGLRATVFEATSAYYAGDVDGARERVAFLADDQGARYPTVRAQALWLRALIIGTAGHESEALVDTREALRLFQAAGEVENVAIMLTRLATYAGYIGDTNESWRHRAAALELFATYGESVRFPSLLLDTARASSEAGHTYAALRFHDAHVRVATQNRDPAVIASAYRLRSLARWRAGKAEPAIADLLAARDAVAKVPDQSMRKRLEANIRATETTVFRESDPPRAIAAATDAIDLFTRLGNRLRLIEMYVERGRAHEANGNFQAALRDTSAAAEEVDRQRAALMTVAQRRDFVERRRTVFEAGVDLMVRRGDFGAAFSFAEASRARVLLDLASPAGENDPWPAEAIRRAMPQGTTLLSYVSLPDRLIIWTVDQKEIRGVVADVSRPMLRAQIREMIGACAGHSAADCRSRSVAVHRSLVAPVRARLTERVVVVPDDLLSGVPFAALSSAVDAPYLVEQHQIVIAPSATIYARRPQVLVAKDARTTALLIGNPMFDRQMLPELPDLPAADTEVRQIGGFYQDATILTGAAATKRLALEALERGEIVHFAGHVVTDAEDGAQSALVFAPEGPGDDGRLRAEEILRHDLAAVPLVVLSSCGTGDRIEAADGPLGFARVFLMAGVPLVVAAITPADDGPTQVLLSKFHHGLVETGDPAAALRAAQLSMIRSGDPSLRAPAAWSSFVVIV